MLSLFSWGKYFIYPFKLFTTWVHECSHGLMALFVGGRVSKITLSPDTSGTTHYLLPKGRVRQGLVASAGYLGSSAVGCLLYYLSQAPHGPVAPDQLELGLGGLMLVSLLFWVRGWFGVLAVASLGIALIALGRLAPAAYAQLLFAFLAIQTGLNALLDIRTLLGADNRVTSDARTMQTLFFLPAWLWAILWLGTSGAMMFWTIRLGG